MRNVTVSVPERVLKEAKHRAVDKGVSLSRYIAQLVERDIEEPSRVDRPEYREAMERQLALMRKGLPLGVGDKVTWTRDELHER